MTVSMIESEWRVDNPQLGAVTRGQFLRMLVNVDNMNQSLASSIQLMKYYSLVSNSS